MELFSNDRSGAVFSKCGKYRFVLWRIWDPSLTSVMFIGLNPSTANQTDDDPTIRRVKAFARKWGHGGVFMLNLFTYVTAYPEELKKCENALVDADIYLQECGRRIGKVVFAWGSFPEAAERAQEVIKMFPDAYALVINKDGSPRHPLYVPGSTELIKYKQDESALS